MPPRSRPAEYGPRRHDRDYDRGGPRDDRRSYDTDGRRSRHRGHDSYRPRSPPGAPLTNRDRHGESHVRDRGERENGNQARDRNTLVEAQVIWSSHKPYEHKLNFVKTDAANTPDLDKLKQKLEGPNAQSQPMALGKATATLDSSATNGSIAKRGFKPIASSESSTSAATASAKAPRLVNNIVKQPFKMNSAETNTKKRPGVNLAAEDNKRLQIKKLSKTPASPAADDDSYDDEPAPTTAAAKAAANDGEVDSLDAYMAEMHAQVAADAAASTTVGDVFEKPDILTDDEGDRAAKATIADQIDEIRGIKKKKEVRVVDWSKEKDKLRPFEKNFYRESADVKALTPHQVKEILERDNIQIHGKHPLKPIVRWENASFPRNIMTVIESYFKFSAPTPIQTVALPTIMSGRDVKAIAQTGSGKTLAYILPMLRHIIAQPKPSRLESQSPSALILIPTRELAAQVHTNARPFTKKLGLKQISIYGGASMSEQVNLIKAGVDIVIGTPGRMIEILEIKKIDLRRVTFFVLDEADRMFDMGFEPQISKIAGNIRPDRQTCCFSATSNAKQDTIARKYLTNPIEITVAGRSTIPRLVSVDVYVLKDSEKFETLLKILGEFSLQDEDPRTLIFVNQQKTAADLLDALMKAGYPCDSIYGSKDQQDRGTAIDDFTNGNVPILIGTSVAARGLDIDQLKLVVQYDPADHMEDNIHRIGRTGRAGKAGRAACFITESQANYAAPLATALKASDRKVPADLQKLVDLYQQQIDAGTARRAHSGFGGRGLERLDQEHDAERRTQRKEAGVDEETKEADANSSDEDDVFTKAVWAKATGTQPTYQDLGKEAKAKVDQFDNIKFDIKKRETPVRTARATASGTTDGLTLAQLAAKEISDRMSSKNTIRQGQSLDNKGRKYYPVCLFIIHFLHIFLQTLESFRYPGTDESSSGATATATAATTAATPEWRDFEYLPPGFCKRCGVPISEIYFVHRSANTANPQPADAGAFHATLEINGFSQRARWQATNRSNIAKLLEKGNCSITNKGRFYAKNEEPGPGDLPKMYILVEADTEAKVSEVMKDLIDLLKKGEVEEQASKPTAATGRYNPLG